LLLAIINRQRAEPALGGRDNRNQILKKVESRRPPAEISHWYQEQMVGSDYPQELKGADSTKESEILIATIACCEKDCLFVQRLPR
jgi:hypothetical protein